MVATKVQLVPANRKLVSAGNNRKTGVTIHQTGNTGRGAGAQAHANLQANGNSRAASWHWQVDDKIAIQSYRHNDRCWHGGNNTANQNRIAIELCVNSDADYPKTLQNAAELTASVLKNIGKTPDNIDQHHTYPQRPNNWHKDCPSQLRAGQAGISWSDFLRMVREAFNGNTPSLPSGGSSGSSGGSSGKSVAQLAQEVIDGKHGNGDARRASLGSQFAAVQAEVNRRLGGGSSGGSSSSSPARKTTAQLAQEVIDGKHGTGDARRRSLGSRYSEVQAEVNRRLGAGSSSSGGSSRKSAQQVAQDIANGQGGWGNAPQRAQRLRAAGYDAADVQRRVNSILAGGSSGSSGGRLTIDQVARQIINGQGGWGNDPQRSQRLRAAGYDAAAVQRRVNQLA